MHFVQAKKSVELMHCLLRKWPFKKLPPDLPLEESDQNIFSLASHFFPIFRIVW
jgi:hypothetical protein